MPHPPDDRDADAEPDEQPVESDEQPVDPRVGQAGDGSSRRWLIRALVGLGLGLPIAIEGATFLGLLDQHFGGGADTDTPSPTPDRDRVGVGDELLPETGPREMLSNAVVDGGSSDVWTLDVVVTVENTGESPYEVRLGTLTLDDGRTVSGGASSGAVQPGESATLTERWQFPAGSLPERVVVFGFVHGGTGDGGSVRRDVRLESIPVEG